VETILLQLLICLVFAHLFADFLTQTDRDVANKHNVLILAKHGAVTALLSYAACGIWTDWRIPLLIFVSHTIIDFCKTSWGRGGVGSFLIDQAAHAAAILLLAFWLVSLLPEGQLFWPRVLGTNYLRALVFLSGVVAAVRFGSFLIAMAVQPLLAQIETKEHASGYAIPCRGLTSGGHIIGQLERLLIFLFVMVDYPEGIGFLLAAKSVLRFGEVKNPEQRMEAEYIIIGTLMSFGLGIIVAFATKWVLQQIV
jgi:Protein of unknown function (DUF3307)